MQMLEHVSTFEEGLKNIFEILPWMHAELQDTQTAKH